MSKSLEAVPAELVVTRARLAAFVDLTKPRIAMLVLAATAVGYYLALPSHVDLSGLLLLLHTLLGTALVAAGANALNQLIEARHDARMQRTLSRPLPSRRLGRWEVAAFGTTTGIVGVTYLAWQTNILASLIALVTLISYVGIYTPLKRKSCLSVFVGAVPGALPPVIGWAAASQNLAFEAWLLFLIVFLWQLPHFAAIAWLYREDYARAGFPVLAVVDTEGTRTDLHMVTHSLGLIGASLLPTVYGLAGAAYAAGAMVLGVGFLACGVFFVLRKARHTARLHVLSSVVYLPLLLALLMIDKVQAG